MTLSFILWQAWAQRTTSHRSRCCQRYASPRDTQLAADGLARVDGVLPAALAAEVSCRAGGSRACGRACSAPRGPALAQKRCRGERGCRRRRLPSAAAWRICAAAARRLFDLCAVVSAPGAPIQPLHSDLGFDGAEAAPLYTCFVALQAAGARSDQFCLGSHVDAAAHGRRFARGLHGRPSPFPSTSARRSSSTRGSRTAAAPAVGAPPRLSVHDVAPACNPGSAPVIVPAPGDVWLVSDGGISAGGRRVDVAGSKRAWCTTSQPSPRRRARAGTRSAPRCATEDAARVPPPPSGPPTSSASRPPRRRRAAPRSPPAPPRPRRRPKPPAAPGVARARERRIYIIDGVQEPPRRVGRRGHLARGLGDRANRTVVTFGLCRPARAPMPPQTVRRPPGPPF